MLNYMELIALVAMSSRKGACQENPVGVVHRVGVAEQLEDDRVPEVCLCVEIGCQVNCL